MAIIDVTEYKIGENTYRYRDASMMEELAEKVNYSDVEATLDDTSEMPIQNQAVANAIAELDNDKLNISDIDDEFDNTSTNPLQNKVITDKINDIGGFASNSHAGIVKVGDSLTMDEIDENPGFLNIRYPAYISPSYTSEDDTTIATYTDNLGNSGVIKVPASVGTEVIPNPIEPATGTLTKIQIDDTVYNIAGSGGGGGPSRVDLLYTNSGTTFDNITLSQAYTNYDIICFTVMTDLAENDEKTSTFFGKDQLQVNDYIRLHGSTTTSNWLKYQIESTTGFSKVAAATSEYVSTVYGIKLGGGSQVSVTPEYSTGTLLATVSIDNVDTEIYAAPEYELPIAGASTLGGIKVGSGLSIDSSTGVLSATGGGGATELDDLTDVSIDDQTLANGQVLKYNGTNWVNAADGGGTVTDVEVDGASVVSSGVASINTMTGAGASAAGSKGLVPAPASGDNEKFLRGDGTWQTVSGGSAAVSTLTDVDLTNLSDGQILQYNGNSGEWVNTTPASLSGYVTAGAAAGSTIGTYATAEGHDVYSTDYQSHAEGEGTVANHRAQHVFGEYNVADSSEAGADERGTYVEIVGNGEGYYTLAAGAYSHAEGYQSVAGTSATHAEGYWTTAVGLGSHAEGQETSAVGSESHAEGYMTSAVGIYAHAEGQRTYAYGDYAHAEGDRTVAAELGSHVEGYNTTAYGLGSHAEGYKTSAYGQASHAEGASTCAIGVNSHAGGFATCSMADYSTAIGKYNAPTAEYAFTVGNGTNNNNRSNAFAVKWDGTIEANGQPISGGTTVVANPASGTAVAPLSNLQVGNDIYSIPGASGGALYGTTNPSDALGSNGSLYFKYNSRKIITTYGKTNNHWTYVAGIKPPEVINFDDPVYFGKQHDYEDGSYTYTATASKRLIAINLCLGVLASGVIDMNTSITTTGTVVDTLTNSTSGGTDNNREMQQIYKIIEVSSGDTITFSNIITSADYSEQTYIIAEIESFITGFTFVDTEVREDNALDNKYNYPLSNDGYYLTYAYGSQRSGTDMTATITSYKNIVDEYTSDSTHGYQIDIAVSDIVDSGTIKCTTKPEYSWATQAYSIIKLNMATTPELVLFDNGSGGSNWTIIGNRGEIRSDCISLQTGSGTFVSQAQYNDQIDLTNYINLHVICRYRGANYNTTFDISSYSGLHTLDFRYITDTQHNEAAVGLTWTNPGSGTQTDILRIASNNNSPAEELLYYFSLS